MYLRGLNSDIIKKSSAKILYDFCYQFSAETQQLPESYAASDQDYMDYINYYLSDMGRSVQTKQ